jgi:hypothetical protein
MRVTIRTENGALTLDNLTQSQVNRLITVYSEMVLDSRCTVDRVRFTVENDR